MVQRYFVLAQAEDPVGKYWFKSGSKEDCKKGISSISQYAPFDKNNYVIREITIDLITDTVTLINTYRIVNGIEVE